MNLAIKNLAPYVVMCVILTTMAIWAKKKEQDSTRELIQGMQTELSALVPDSGDSILIDVRTAQEYKLGHIADSYNIPGDRIGHEIPFLAMNREKPVILYCTSGRRAQLIKKGLEDIGYKRVYNLNSLYRQKLDAHASRSR